MAMGEIWVSSPGVMRQYWREPTPVGEPLRDGWLNTGDLGFMQGGELFVGGRVKDVIFHGGAICSPRITRRSPSRSPA